MVEAIRREKSIKRWRRGWKIALIEGVNPQWLDLWDVLHAAQPPDAAHVKPLIGSPPNTASSRAE